MGCVKAQIQPSGAEVSAKSGIEQLQYDAEESAEENKIRRERIEARNEIEAEIHYTVTFLRAMVRSLWTNNQGKEDVVKETRKLIHDQDATADT